MTSGHDIDSSPPPAARKKKKHGKLWFVSRGLWRDTRNVTKYGRQAPRWAQRIWVNPSDCSVYTTSYNRSFLGQVRDGDWDREVLPLESHPKIVACRKHWLEGQTWEETGIIDFVSQAIAVRGYKDGCRSVDDVIERYKNLDRLFQQVRYDGRIKQRREVIPGNYKESGGILIHVGRNAEPVFGGGGCHRLAIAQILELESIPAVVGIIHEAALPVWRDRYIKQVRPAR